MESSLHLLHMNASMDISLYPLDQEYRDIILTYLSVLKERYSLRIETNGMSTQLFGNYDDLMHILQTEVKEYLFAYHAVAVVKLVAGEKTAEKLPKEIPS